MKFTDDLSIRDYFAGQALAGLVAGIQHTGVSNARLTEMAYEMADMMITQRLKETERGGRYKFNNYDI